MGKLNLGHKSAESHNVPICDAMWRPEPRNESRRSAGHAGAGDTNIRNNQGIGVSGDGAVKKGAYAMDPLAMMSTRLS